MERGEIPINRPTARRPTDRPTAAQIAEYEVGLAHFFLQHTSASLTVNENASPDVPLVSSAASLVGQSKQKTSWKQPTNQPLITDHPRKKYSQDLADALDRLAPEGDKFPYRHDDEVRTCSAAPTK